MKQEHPRYVSTYRGKHVYELEDGSFAPAKYLKDGAPVFGYREHNTAWEAKSAIDEDLRP